MTRIRRERALLEAYERDGWRGAAKEKLKPVEVSRSRRGSGLGVAHFAHRSTLAGRREGARADRHFFLSV